ncbi:MAG: hypothetical protein LBB05_00700 [Puniceicoccales bacterium]|jgi:hypothetical protein|nr:hypothetical protein [Puniceicoccales bacterium]
MSLILEGLKRNGQPKQQLPGTALQTELSEKTSAIQVSPNAPQAEQLRNGLQYSPFIFKLQNSTKFNFLSAFKSGLATGLIILEPLFTALYKLLDFVKLTQLCHFIILRLPIAGLTAIGSFFKQQWSFLCDCTAIAFNRLRTKVEQGLVATGNIFSSIFQCYRTVLDKVSSIYLPNRWIQSTTAFLLKSSAIVLSCCFIVTIVRNAIRSSTLQNTEHSTDNTVAQKETRQLKHSFKDPLLIKQEKVRDALLAFHIDTIRRHEDGKGQIITDNQTFGIGSLLCEHPKIYLEKIGKNSLYFSDKYGQLYKRSIGNMLE